MSTENDKKSAEKKVTLTLKLSESDKKFLQKQAELVNMNMNEYVMRVVHSRPVFHINKETLNNLLSEMHKIGSNVTQIAHVLNSQKYIDKELFKQIREVETEIKKLEYLMYLIVEEIANPTKKHYFPDEKELHSLALLNRIREELEVVIDTLGKK
jgi:hypothetical protein